MRNIISASILAFALTASGSSTALASEAGVDENDGPQKAIVLNEKHLLAIRCADEIKNAVDGLSPQCQQYLNDLFSEKLSRANLVVPMREQGFFMVTGEDDVFIVPDICTLIKYGPESPWVDICG